MAEPLKPTTIYDINPVTLYAALGVVAAARRRADELGVAMNIAVVDTGANLVAFVRMDGAWLGSVEIAQNKAYTARAFDISTKDLAALSQPGKPLFGIADSAGARGERVVIFAGGVPLIAGGKVVGGVGVSGGQPDQDDAVAAAGAAAFQPGLHDMDPPSLSNITL